MKKIGLMGLAFYSGNKGCCALAYSFLEVLNIIATTKKDCYDIFIFQDGWKRVMMPQSTYSNLRLHMVPIMKKKILKCLLDLGIKKCDMIIDFTAGDSFTDLYGMERFSYRTAIKEKVLRYKVPLVLGSQTYGPFDDKEAVERASKVLMQAKEVFSRDEISSEVVRTISKREPITTSDIAFFLPYEPQRIRTEGKIRIGVNPSGLLWNGGYTQDNQFGLKVDYRKYIYELMEFLDNDNRYEVYLIPHVLSENLELVDNDCVPCLELKKQFSRAHYILDDRNDFDYKGLLPSELKNVIAAMDIFTGARMHSTIAAFSSGVPVIPFSYSRKFEGLYQSYDYKYVIGGTTDTTEDALSKTITWIQNYKELGAAVKKSEDISEKYKTLLLEKMTDVIYEGEK